MEIIDLKNKTILNFTQDKDIISKVISIPASVDYDEYIEFYIESCHPVNLIADIVAFAKIIGNTKLEQEAQNLYTQILDESVNKAHEIHATTGMLVD